MNKNTYSLCRIKDSIVIKLCKKEIGIQNLLKGISFFLSTVQCPISVNMGHVTALHYILQDITTTKNFKPYKCYTFKKKTLKSLLLMVNKENLIGIARLCEFFNWNRKLSFSQFFLSTKIFNKVSQNLNTYHLTKFFLANLEVPYDIIKNSQVYIVEIKCLLGIHKVMSQNSLKFFPQIFLETSFQFGHIV